MHFKTLTKLYVKLKLFDLIKSIVEYNLLILPFSVQIKDINFVVNEQHCITMTATTAKRLP